MSLVDGRLHGNGNGDETAVPGTKPEETLDGLTVEEESTPTAEAEALRVGPNEDINESVEVTLNPLHQISTSDLRPAIPTHSTPEEGTAKRPDNLLASTDDAKTSVQATDEPSTIDPNQDVASAPPLIEELPIEKSHQTAISEGLIPSSSTQEQPSGFFDRDFNPQPDTLETGFDPNGIEEKIAEALSRLEEEESAAIEKATAQIHEDFAARKEQAARLAEEAKKALTEAKNDIAQIEALVKTA